MWTEEQWEAITAEGCNILVSAAAGAGKTAVLAQRILHLLGADNDPADIDRMLVVTFTEAAAAEMRERIGIALEKAIQAEGRYELRKQYALLSGASISTLHSFCLDVIRRYFYLLDLDPAPRVADDLEAKLMRQDVADRLLENSFKETNNSLFTALASRYSGGVDDALGPLILRLYSYAWSNPWPEAWLNRAASAFILPDEETDESVLEYWLCPIREHLSRSAESTAAWLSEAQKICRLPGGPLAYEDTLAKELNYAGNLAGLTSGSWDKLREAWLGFGFTRLPAAKNADEDLKEQAQARRDKAKKEIKKCGDIYFTRCLEQYRNEITNMAPLMTEMKELVLRFARLYSQEKKNAGLLDFNDLEHYCLQILLADGAAPDNPQPSAAALELRGRYDYVLVDEYQDINPVQDTILRLVSRTEPGFSNLFMVGDVKQSIYRFRLGDPHLFMERYRSFPKTSGLPDRKITLSKNFRCREGIIHAVNFLFRQLMCEKTAEIDYDSEAELVCGAQYPWADGDNLLAGPVEVHLAEQGEKEEKDDDDDVPKEDLLSIEKEGMIASALIRDLVNGGNEPQLVYDKEIQSYRAIAYRDIVILLRATSGNADLLVEILSGQGIPAYADLSAGYFAATEIETMVSLLKVLDNPCQDIELAAVLRSPIFGFSVAELAQIARNGDRNGDFYNALLSAADAGLPGLSERLTAFLRRLENWRTRVRREKLAGFLADIYRESGFARYVLGLPGGSGRQANLYALFDRARQFDRFARQGLHRFLAFIDQLRQSGDDFGTARVLGEKEDVVRVMSIHKAKGLEFPVVLLCGLGKRFNFSDLRQNLLVHRRMGIGPLLIEQKLKISYPSLPYLALRLMGEAETRAEEMRILYVALTRAREKLILIGSLKGIPEYLNSWKAYGSHPDAPLPAHLVSKAKNCLEWIGPALMRHQDMQNSTGEQESAANFSLYIHAKIPDGEFGHAEEKLYDTEKENILNLEPLKVQLPPVLLHNIRERLSYRYPYPRLPLPAKLAVSELKSALRREDEEAAALVQPAWEQPGFLTGAHGGTATRRGSLYHLVLQNLDLGGPLDEEGIASQISKMKDKGIITSEEEKIVHSRPIARFFNSRAGRIVLSQSLRVWREWPFTVAVGAAEIYPYTQSDEYVVVQGIIDLLAETRNSYVIIDYKTDGIPGGGVIELAERYREQINYYRLAVNKLMPGKTVAAYLYFLAAADCVEL